MIENDRQKTEKTQSDFGLGEKKLIMLSVNCNSSPIRDVLALGHWRQLVISKARIFMRKKYLNYASKNALKVDEYV